MHHYLSLPLPHYVEGCEAPWQPPKATHDALAPRIHSQGLPRDHAHYRALNGPRGALSRAAASPLVGCPPQPLECLLSPLCVGSLPPLPLPQPPPPLPKPPSGVKCVCTYKGCVWSACAHKPRATCTPGCNAGHAMGLFQGKEKTLATLREAEGEAHSRAPHPPPLPCLNKHLALPTSRERLRRSATRKMSPLLAEISESQPIPL